MSDNGNQQKQHPEWQKAIRAAQAAKLALIEKDVQQRLEKDRQFERAQASVLKLVLAKLGIEAEPETSQVVIGDYRFSYYALGGSYESRPSFNLGVVRAEFDTDAEDAPYGRLILLEGYYMDDAWMSVVSPESWEVLKADLADKLDDLDMRSEIAKTSRARRAAAPAVKPPKTTEEQLIELLREFVNGVVVGTDYEPF